ncbi:MAG: phytoene/squalene synthase family protein [Anaerolineae bacterium]
MSTPSLTWEQRLLEQAYQGLEAEPVSTDLAAGAGRLERAYRASEEIIRTHSRTFYLASALLPADKRRGARALYAFSRLTDDAVDGCSADPRQALKRWRQRVRRAPDPNDLPLLAWKDTQRRYGIPEVYACQLLDGVARDLEQTRYATFEALTEYCYGVASTVGLMAMYIVGFHSEDALPYAVKLGVALQLTNILRDVGEDWARGRLYLPQDELAAFGVTEADIDAGHADDRWRAFMRFQVDRVRRLYRASLPGVAYLHRDGRFAIAAAAQLYEAILDDLEANGMDNLNRRAYIGLGGKLRRLPRIWWNVSTLKRSNVLRLRY